MPQSSLAQGAPHSASLLAGIAERLAALSQDAEDFGLVLCSDADVAGRHLVELQQIDRLAQSLREIARVLVATEPDLAVSSICLGELRGALELAGEG